MTRITPVKTSDDLSGVELSNVKNGTVTRTAHYRYGKVYFGTYVYKCTTSWNGSALLFKASGLSFGMAVSDYFYGSLNSAGNCWGYTPAAISSGASIGFTIIGILP